MKRLLAGLLATVTLMPAALSLGSTSVSAAPTPPASVTLNVHKGEFSTARPTGNMDGTTASKPGTWTDFNTDRGDVKFSLVNVTGAIEKILGKDLDDATGTEIESARTALETLLNSATYKKADANYDIAKILADTTNFPSAAQVGSETQISAKTGTPPSTATFTNVPGEGAYVVLETESPSTVNEKATPMVLFVPMTNPTGDGYLSTIELYAKNQIQEKTTDFTKINVDADGNETEGAGIEFKIYEGTPGSGTFPPSGMTEAAATKVTDTNGKIQIAGLSKVAKYYLVETGVGIPAGYLPSPLAQNDARNVLQFEIKSDGLYVNGIKEGEEGFTPLVLRNYVEPVTVKTVPKDNYDVGQKAEYNSTVTLPRDLGDWGPVGTDNPYLRYEDKGLTGLTFVDDSDMEVKLGSTTLTKGTHFWYTKVGNGFTIDFINPTTGVAHADLIAAAKATPAQKVTIKYFMTVNEEALTIVGDPLNNEYVLKYDNGPKTDNNKPKEVPVYTGGEQFIKKGEGTDAAKLAGAKFLVKDSDGKYYAGITAGKVVWTDDIDVAKTGGTLTADADGHFEITGLEYGTYYLEEIYAPDGYQLAQNNVEFKITATSYKDTVRLDVYNKKKPNLPITGGMGTVIFTILGLTVMGAAALYVFRNRKTA